MSAHYVYRCYADDGSLLYVGATKDVPGRLAQHRATSFWAMQTAKVRSRVYCDKQTAHEVERRAIIDEDPKYNIRSKPNARDRWSEQDFDDQICKLATLPISSTTRTQFERLFEDYIGRFGRRHPLEERVTLRLDTFEANRAAQWKRQAEVEAERHRLFKEREAAENALHLQHCCSCRYGIIVDDELIKAYGNKFSVTEVFGDPS